MLCNPWITATLVVFLLFTVEITCAQSDPDRSDLSPGIFDTSYMVDYTGLLTSRALLVFQNASLIINPATDRIQKIVYRPNVNLKIGIAGFYKWFGLGLAFDNPFYKTNRDTYGKTSSIDVRINSFGRTYAGELFFQKYKGFYLSSPQKADGSNYVIPDMETVSIGIAGYWIYNAKKFSIRAAFIQNERQRRSAGSLVVRPAFLYYRISSDQGIIPAEIMEEYQIPLANHITNSKIYTLGISPGYVYTFVFLKDFYITAAVFPGVAMQFSSFSTATMSDSDFEFVFQLGVRFALGYNSDKWFLGGSVQTGFNEVPVELNNALFSYDVAQIQLWGGTRFNFFKKKKRDHAGY